MPCCTSSVFLIYSAHVIPLKRGIYQQRRLGIKNLRLWEYDKRVIGSFRRQFIKVFKEKGLIECDMFIEYAR